MFVAVMMIVLGVAIVLWGKWLLPRQLRKARNKMPRDRQERFNDSLRRPGVQCLFAMQTIWGGLTIIVGIVFWLTK
jgi:hypothetical protein